MQTTRMRDANKKKKYLQIHVYAQHRIQLVDEAETEGRG